MNTQKLVQLLLHAALVGAGLASLLLTLFYRQPGSESGRILLPAAAIALVGVWGVWTGLRGQTRADEPRSPVPAPAEVRVPDGRRAKRDLQIVAIGGGTGMPQLLRGLRAYSDHITAIVTVADDGGSSGRIRRQMGMLPPGDFRNNIAALSEAEDLMTRLLQYRFAQRDVGGNGDRELAGHSFGNLFITTMAAVTGSFEQGIAESSRVLAVRGRILPATLEHVTLCAEISRRSEDGRDEWQIVRGESNIPRTGGRIVRVFLEPDTPRGYPAVIQAILRADLIVAGPGSFYTSVMPNLLVPSVRDAICASRAQRIYICNVATQPGETDGYSVSDHMRQLQVHAGDAFSTVLANDNYDPAHPPYPNGQWVELPDSEKATKYRCFSGDLSLADLPSHHDPVKLAARLVDVYYELEQEKAAN